MFTAQRLGGLVRQSVTEELARLAASPPELLFHYTDASGLQGIIEQTGIYLTDARFLNDAGEMSYGQDVFLEGLHRFVTNEPNEFRARVWSELARGDRRSSDTREWWSHEHSHVASFCSDGNLLSQWRAYGTPQGAFSIGFNAAQMVGNATVVGAQEPVGAASSAVTLRRVLYDGRQQSELIDAVIRCSFAAAETVSHPSAPLYFANTIVSSVIPDVVPQIKSPAFAEEQEWRLVCRWHAKVRFRTGVRGITPYLLCNLMPSQPPSRLPIQQVWIGPSSDSRLSRIAALEILRQHGFAPGLIEIKDSGIPLRV